MCLQLMYVVAYDPEYGPLAGGTKVNITVAHLEPPWNVTSILIQKPCPIIGR